MSDYLWDRSGEPDKDIQRLEEILSPLSYQPRPLEIPAGVTPGRRRNFNPVVALGAIAAAVALVALALGVWLSINRAGSVQPNEARMTPGSEQKDHNSSPSVAAGPEKEKPLPAEQNRYSSEPVDRAPNRNLAAGGGRNPGRTPKPHTTMTIASREEALAAKEQLMVALRLASTKLSQAQKRTQGGYPGNFIRNQHKVG